MSKNYFKNLFIIYINLLFLILIIFFNYKSYAQSNIIDLNDTNLSYYIDDKLEYLEDKDKTLNIKDIIKPINSKKFVNANNRLRNLGYSDSAYWIKINLNNKTQFKRWILEVAFPRLESVQLYIPNKNEFIIKESGTSKPYAQRDFKIRNIAFEMIIQQKETIFLRVESHYSAMQIPIKIYSLKGLTENTIKEEIFFNICYGILLISILYCISTYYSLKDPIYLFSGVFILVLFFQHLAINGHGFYLLWSNYPNFNLKSPWLFGFLGNILGLLSISRISKILKSKKVYKIIILISILMTLISFISLVLSLTTIFNVLFLISILFFLLTSNPYLYDLKDTYIRKIYYSWICLISSYFIYTLNRLGLISKTFFTDNIFLINLCISTLFIFISLNLKYKRDLEEKNRYYSELEELNKELALYKDHLEDLVNKKTKEILESKKAAEKVATLKSEFLATMSHEIRTPMNAVIGMTDLLSITELNEEQKYFVDTIKSSGNILIGIINDILDFSKIESGNMELEKKEFLLESCIEDVIDLFALQINEKKLDLFYTIENDVPDILISDLIRLKQILLNLVSNAIKFTNSGYIFISISKIDLENDKVNLLFSIEDSGIGVSEDKKDRLFKSFSQADSSINRKFGGTGLGLVISKKLSNLFEGDLNFKPNSNKGSIFYFNIKSYFINSKNKNDSLIHKKIYINSKNENFIKVIKKYAEKSKTSIDLNINNSENIIISDLDNLIHDINISKNNILIGNINSLKSRNIDETSDNFIFKPFKYSDFINTIYSLENKDIRTESHINNKEFLNNNNLNLGSTYPLKILVAEDNLVNQKLIEKVFEKLGYKIDIKSNGLEAFECVKNKNYDLVFMDIQMPIMDGIESSKLIQETLKDKAPKIIALTANVLEEDQKKYFDVGMFKCISKPFRFKEIRDLIIKIIEE